MKTRTVHPTLRVVLEFGPIVGFLVAYLLYRDDTFLIFGTEYTGFVAVTAAFIPVFLLGIGALWVLTRRIARVQVMTAVMLVIFGGLSVSLNDPRFFKMKPTAIYLCLALVLGFGLLRGQFWLKYIMEDMIPLKKRGWRILTRRVTVL
ncbi:MAG: septation protein IspZ, partial [Pseudomonadota bacterium]